MSDDPGYSTLLAQAQRNITRQEASLDLVRGRAVALLAVGSTVAGLSTGAFFGVHKSGWHLAVAAVALTLYVVTVLLVLLMSFSQTYKFSGSISIYIDNLRAGTPIDIDSMEFNMARDMQTWRDENHDKIETLYRVFNVLCVATGVEVVLWVVSAF